MEREEGKKRKKKCRWERCRALPSACRCEKELKASCFFDRAARFPERRKERLARKPSISNQSNLPVIICDQHQITPARHDPSSLRCDGPLYGCVYTGGGRRGKGRERKGESESGRGGLGSHRNGARSPPSPPRLPASPSRRSPKLHGRGRAGSLAAGPAAASACHQPPFPSPSPLLRGQLDWRKINN